MSQASVVQYGLFLLIVTLLVKPVGAYMARVFSGEWTPLDRVLRPLERITYRLGGVDPAVEMDWKRYAAAFLLFSVAGTLLLYAVLRTQPGFHPADPGAAGTARRGG